MCFNAALVQSPERIEKIFSARIAEEYLAEPWYFRSAFEHPAWPVLKQGKPEAFSLLVWGLIPAWIKNADDAASIRNKTLNARFETINVKPSFRSSVNRRRCAVLVDGFVEWRLWNGKKYPYHIAMPERRPFLLAGLWDTWAHPQSDTRLETFTVVTIEAQGIPAQVHNTKNRMPLILSADTSSLWLNPDLPYSGIRGELEPYYEGLVAWPVSPSVSRPREPKNLPGIQERFDYSGLPELTVSKPQDSPGGSGY